MKFAKYLHAESVPEWRKKYIDYKGLKKAIKRAHQAKVSASQQPQLQEQQQEPSSSSSVVGVSVKRFSQRDQQRTSLDVGRIDRHYGTLNEHNTSSLPRDPHTNDVNDLTSTSSQNSAQPPKETDVAPVHSNVPPSKAVAFGTPSMTQDNPSVSRQPLLPSASVASASASSSVVAIAAAKEVMTPVPMAARRKHFRNFSTQSGMRMLRRVSTSFGWPLAPLDQVNEDKSHSRQPSNSKDEIAPISKMTPEEAERALSMILLGCTQEEIDFFDMLNAELEMVEQFYKENEVKLVERLELLQKQCEMVVAYENKQITSANLPISLTAAPSPRNMESGVIPLTVSLTDEMRASTSNGIITRLQTANVGYLRQLGNAWHPSPSPTPSINTEREAITASLSEEHRIENQAKAAKRRIRKALLEFYRNIRLLQNYRALNQTGFVKILKKFDKMTGNECKELYLKKMEDYKFNQPVNLQTTQGRAEELFTKYFEDGSRRRAMQLLRLPTEETHASIISQVVNTLEIAN
ncbi:SPX domain-containing protein [Syncephalis plumigaleata]|nr:SPX domain-containing protein [Syncephalis plumigaleata]